MLPTTEKTEVEELKIGSDFKINLNKKLGSGSFWDIFRGYNIKTNEEVAVKVESNNIKTPQLAYKGKVMKMLQRAPGIPDIYHNCVLGEYTIMVLELLDKNLEELLQNTTNKKCSLKQCWC